MISLYPNQKTRLTDLYGRPCDNETAFEINADNSYLYATFTCFFKEKPKDMTAIHGKKVYRDECVELFIGSKKEYYEIDVSAYNLRFVALVENPNNEPEPIAEETEIEGLETDIEWADSYYIARYKLPIESIKTFGEEVYYNAFRVEMVKGERVSRTISKTNSKSHHNTEAFISINLL